MGNWRNDKPSIVFERDEASVKEVVNARRQEQPVLAVRRWRTRQGHAGQPRHDPRLHNMSQDHRGATIDIGAWLTVWRKRTNMM
jgi:hypothetical protein